jgi:hypothetical protein
MKMLFVYSKERIVIASRIYNRFEYPLKEGNETVVFDVNESLVVVYVEITVLCR